MCPPFTLTTESHAMKSMFTVSSTNIRGVSAFRKNALLFSAGLAMFCALMLAARPAHAVIVYICFDYADCANCKATYGDDNCFLKTAALKKPKGTTFIKFRDTDAAMSLAVKQKMVLAPTPNLAVSAPKK